MITARIAAALRASFDSAVFGPYAIPTLNEVADLRDHIRAWELGYYNRCEGRPVRNVHGNWMLEGRCHVVSGNCQCDEKRMNVLGWECHSGHPHDTEAECLACTKPSAWESE